MAKRTYTPQEAMAEISKALRKRIDDFAEELVLLRKKEASVKKAVHSIKSEPCPLCGEEDKPGVCKCELGSKKKTEKKELDKCGEMLDKSQLCLLCGREDTPGVCQCVLLTKNIPVEDHLTAGAEIARQAIHNPEAGITSALAYGKHRARAAASQEAKQGKAPLPIPPKDIPPVPAKTSALSDSPKTVPVEPPAAAPTREIKLPGYTSPKRQRSNRGANRASTKGDGSYRGGRGNEKKLRGGIKKEEMDPTLDEDAVLPEDAGVKEVSKDNGSGGEIKKLKKDAMPSMSGEMKQPKMPKLPGPLAAPKIGAPEGIPGAKMGQAPKAPNAPKAPGAN